MPRHGGVDYVCPSIRSYLSQCKNPAQAERLSQISTKDIITECRVRVALSRDCTAPYDLERILAYTESMVAWIGSMQWSLPVAFLDINLWLTPLRKIWCPQPLGINLIGKCEVNSGETYFSHRDRRQITVWRAEDWSKVLLHELLHAFGWDRLVPATPDNQTEALVETMATLLHCQLLGGPNGWMAILARERSWMTQQVAALQAYQWKPQGTSVRSYYILKTSLINHLPEFAEWLRQSSVSKLRESWPELAARTVKHTLENLPRSVHQGCLEMRMVFAQLSLNPIPTS